MKFHVSSQKIEILHFDGFLLSKSHKVSAKNVQKSYLSWCWRLTQILKKSWHVVSNMTWGIWWIFTQSLKSPKISLRWAIFVQSIWGLSYKNREELSFMTLNSDAKFGNPDLVVSKMAWGIGWTFIRVLKNMKKCTLMTLFTQNIEFFSKKIHRNYVSWQWRLMQYFNENWLVAWKMTKNLVSFHVSSRKSKNLHFYGLLLTKTCKDLDEKLQKSYVSWHWKVMQSLNKNLLLVPKITWRSAFIVSSVS